MQAVFGKHRAVGHLVAALLGQAGIHPGNVVEAAGVEVLGIDHIAPAARGGVEGLAHARVLQSQRPLAGQAEQLVVVAQLDAVAQQVLVVALQVRAAASHPAIVGVAVAFEVAVVALGVVVVQRVLHAGAVAELVVEDRA
ncbi:hypothetical protein D3C71_1326530 [compost metagenome]